MDKPSILKVLEALAEGVDPVTGEVIEHGVFERPQVIRGLFGAIELIRGTAEPKTRARGDKEKALPPAAGLPWSAEEEAQLRTRFIQGATIRELADLHARTPGAIKARLIRIGLLDSEGNPKIEHGPVADA